MANTRIELPDGDWADVRDPKKVPERLRRPVREAALNLQQALPEDQRRRNIKMSQEPAQVAEPDVQEAFGAPPIDELVADEAKKDELPFLPTAEQQSLVDVYNEALLVSIVAAWSFGDVTVDAVRDLPGDSFDILLKYAAKDGAEGAADSLAADPSAP